MSKKQHLSQEQLKAYFGDNSDAIAENLAKLEKIEEANKSQKAAEKAQKKAAKANKPPTILVLQRDNAFCLKTAIARVEFLLKSEKVNKFAEIQANGQKFTFTNLGEGTWEFAGINRTVKGKKRDLCWSIGAEVCAAFRPNNQNSSVADPATK